MCLSQDRVQLWAVIFVVLNIRWLLPESRLFIDLYAIKMYRVLLPKVAVDCLARLLCYVEGRVSNLVFETDILTQIFPDFLRPTCLK
jgi:hypothetical protein